MKKISISTLTVAAILSAAPALAADLPSIKGPPPVYVPPPPLWTGFYAGLNAGYTFGGSDSVYVATFPGFVNPLFTGLLPGFFEGQAAAAAASASGILSPRLDGFIGGGQVGYNWQFNNSFVVGIEADIQGSGARGSATGIGVGANPLGVLVGSPGLGAVSTLSVTKNLDYLGTVRGRLGWLATPTLLAFVSGGLAYGGVNTTVNFSSNETPTAIVGGGFLPSIASFSDTRVGWTVGGGLEWMFMPNLSAKLEYLYYDLGSYSFAAGGQTNISPFFGLATGAIGVSSNFTQASTRYNGHIVRVGLNYHFNWGAPVVAKY